MPSNFQTISQISVEQLAELLKSGSNEPLQLIDVREPTELAIAQLQGFQNLPLSQFAQWSNTIQTELDPHTETLVLCHHGVRSAQMCQWLTQQGFTNVKNISGGIDAYSLRVDAEIERY